MEDTKLSKKVYKIKVKWVDIPFFLQDKNKMFHNYRLESVQMISQRK